MQAVGEPFPFRGHGIMSLGLDSQSVVEADPEATRETPEPDTPDTRLTYPPLPVTPETPASVPPQRRIIPDFVPDTVEPGFAREEPPNETFLSRLQDGRLWTLLAAIAVVAAGAAFLIIPGHHSPAPAPPPSQAGEPDRPLGLNVGPSGSIWRVTWNPNATALQNARGVELFVREGDDQRRIDLTPGDLASGTYEYRPTSSDVTFRLEATASSGAITAESFRYDRSQPPAAVASSGATPKAAPTPAPAPPPSQAKSAAVPRAIRRVPPIVASSIRPRIPGMIPIDVRVKVDRKGRVISAVPVAKQRDGLHKYLAQRAVIAARQWRFQPEAAGGEETIHFVFQK